MEERVAVENNYAPMDNVNIHHIKQALSANGPLTALDVPKHLTDRFIQYIAKKQNVKQRLVITKKYMCPGHNTVGAV